MGLFDILAKGFQAVTGIPVTKGIKAVVKRIAVPKLFLKPTKTQAALGIGAGVIALGGAPAVGRVAVSVARRAAKPIIARPFRSALIGTTLAGAIQASPIIRKAITGRIKDPLGGGRFVGETVERIAAGKPPTEPSDILKALQAAGLIGAGLTAGAVAITGIKKIRERFFTEKVLTQSSFQLIPSTPVFPVEKPLGAVEREEKKEVAPQIGVPAISNKNIFKPEINIRISKSRKFINQQVMVRR